MVNEILTLQFGNFSNYIGCHFWNNQEHSFNYESPTAEEEDENEINNDILYREGLFNGNVTYTPRMLLVDRSNYLRYFNDDGNLYNDPNNLHIQENLEEDVEKLEPDLEKPHDFQVDLAASGNVDNSKNYELKDSIRNWPDFIYSRYHPRSLNDLKGFVNNETLHSLDTFSSGELVWGDYSAFQDDYCDKIRSYIEECNLCQGFQVLFDAYDGFAGMSVKCLEYLQDDYRKPALTFPVFAPKVENFSNADDALSDSIRLVNIAYSYSKLSEFSDLFIPLSTMSKTWRKLEDPRKYSGIQFDSTNLYHSSSILSTFLDTMSMKYRMKNSVSSIGSFCAEQNYHNRKMSSGKISLPFPINEKEDLIDFLDSYDGNLLESVSPGRDCGSDGIIQNSTLRGIPQSRLKKPMEQAKNQLKMAAYKCSSISEMIQFYFYCNSYASLTHTSSMERAMTIKSPYPVEIFEDTSNRNIPIMTTVETSSKLSSNLEHLHTQVSRIKIAKIPRFFDSGMEHEEYKEILENLLAMKENYEDNEFL